jgi:hypothetical protein
MRLASTFALVMMTACTVAEPDDEPGGGGEDAASAGGPDATGTSGGDDGGTGGTCDTPSTALPFGNHNAGLACLGCHNGTGVAPRWTVAGTLYSAAQNGTPIAGATITVTDANNVTVRLVTASNGNFYTGQTLAMPLRVKASRCPDTRMMSARPSTGDCNSCHQAATTGRIHLP